MPERELLPGLRDQLLAAAERLVGERDFAALGSNAHGATVRHLSEVRVTRRGDLVEIRVTANAFLKRMVRGIVAVLLEVGRGRLAPEAIDRTRLALLGYAAEVAELGIERVRMVATSASRDASNAADFRDMVRSVLGVEPEVITGDEEARLSFAGAVRGLDGEPPPPARPCDSSSNRSAPATGAASTRRTVTRSPSRCVSPLRSPMRAWRSS